MEGRCVNLLHYGMGRIRRHIQQLFAWFITSLPLGRSRREEEPGEPAAWGRSLNFFRASPQFDYRLKMLPTQGSRYISMAGCYIRVRARVITVFRFDRTIIRTGTNSFDFSDHGPSSCMALLCDVAFCLGPQNFSGCTRVFV